MVKEISARQLLNLAFDDIIIMTSTALNRSQALHFKIIITVLNNIIYSAGVMFSHIGNNAHYFK